jgi:glutaredoxin
MTNRIEYQKDVSQLTLIEIDSLTKKIMELFDENGCKYEVFYVLENSEETKIKGGNVEHLTVPYVFFYHFFNFFANFQKNIESLREFVKQGNYLDIFGKSNTTPTDTTTKDTTTTDTTATDTTTKDTPENEDSQDDTMGQSPPQDTGQPPDGSEEQLPQTGSEEPPSQTDSEKQPIDGLEEQLPQTDSEKQPPDGLEEQLPQTGSEEQPPDGLEEQPPDGLEEQSQDTTMGQSNIQDTGEPPQDDSENQMPVPTDTQLKTMYVQMVNSKIQKIKIKMKSKMNKYDKSIYKFI